MSVAPCGGSEECWQPEGFGGPVPGVQPSFVGTKAASACLHTQLSFEPKKV